MSRSGTPHASLIAAGAGTRSVAGMTTHPTPTLQLVTFRLDGLSHEAYVAHCEQAAPAFAPGAIDGLQSKTWLADPATNTYGGLYAWRDPAAAEAYLRGDVYAGLLANPHMAHVRAARFAVLPGPTAVTGR
jgi:hypothetical protein